MVNSLCAGAFAGSWLPILLLQSRETGATAHRYAKFWLGPVALADNRGFRNHELTEIRQIVVENRHFFQEKWHEYFGRKS